MKLIIGGAYQSKLNYARTTYKIGDGWIDGRNCTLDELSVCRGIDHFHELVKRMLQEDDGVAVDMTSEKKATFYADDLSGLEGQAKLFAEWLYQKNPDIVIITNELGYGVVPMEKADRMWREVTGRICTALVEKADEVVRVVCGIGMRLK